MKTLRLILMLALCSGCATRKAAERPSIPKSTSSLSASETPEVRTEEIVKAYPVGRYSDPDFPEAMYECHTLYRREQAAEWNHRPSNSYALPLGPVVAESNPSPSYYVKTDAEQMNAQQKAYAEALLEQNRALNQRIEDLRKQDSTIQNLKEEIERLKKQRETESHTDAPAPEKASPQSTPETQEGFSALDGGPLPEEDSISDPGDLILFPRCEEDYGAFLISQMRLNSELSQQLDAIVRRRLALLITGSRFPLNYTFNTPTP
jgi:TolA-binding protein